MKTLQELTGRESGIVIYGGATGVICNWVGINGYPRLFANGIIGLGEEIPETVGNHEELAYLLHGADIVYTIDGEEIPVYGTVYRIADDITVICPDGWA